MYVLSALDVVRHATEQRCVQQQYIVTGLVLVAAVTIDALSRRGSASGSVTRI